MVKSKVVQFRVSEKEQLALKRLASQYNTTISQLIISKVFNTDDIMKSTDISIPPKLAEALIQKAYNAKILSRMDRGV